MIPARSRKATDSRSKGLAKIHIAKKQLCLTDEAYQDILFNIAGVRSSKYLDEKGIKDVLQYLRECGFRPAHKSAKASGMHLPSTPDREPYLSKIGSLLTDLGKPWNYADAITRHAFGIDRVRWLKPEQLRKVMIMLLKNQRNLEKKEGNGNE